MTDGSCTLRIWVSYWEEGLASFQKSPGMRQQPCCLFYIVIDHWTAVQIDMSYPDPSLMEQLLAPPCRLLGQELVIDRELIMGRQSPREARKLCHHSSRPGVKSPGTCRPRGMCHWCRGKWSFKNSPARSLGTRCWNSALNILQGTFGGATDFFFFIWLVFIICKMEVRIINTIHFSHC